MKFKILCALAVSLVIQRAVAQNEAQLFPSNKALEAATIDQVAIGEQQPESDHNFQSENSKSGVHLGRHWRDARGWFSYDLKNPDLKAKKLRVTYFGGDRNRNFDVFVNDILIKKVSLTGSAPNQFIDVDYDLPQTVQESKKLSLKFVADRGSVAGGVFYVRLLAAEKIAERQQEIKKEEKVKAGKETSAIDQVAPGEQQPESDHNFQSENSKSGVHLGRQWRDARGWFSYDLKNPELKAKKLRVTYFGGDRNRNFEVFVNDILIKKVSLTGSAPNQFIDVDYDLPQTVQESKKLSLKFVADRGSVAGGVFYVKLLAN